MEEELEEEQSNAELLGDRYRKLLLQVTQPCPPDGPGAPLTRERHPQSFHSTQNGKGKVWVGF